MDTLCRKIWIVPADLEAVNSICAEVAGWLGENGMDRHGFSIEILMREALNNAIIHGSQNDASRNVQALVWCDAEAIWLKVCDEGAGFNWHAALQSEMAGDDKESGRGLKLYQLYADRVEFNERGNQITLARSLDHGRLAGSVQNENKGR